MPILYTDRLIVEIVEIATFWILHQVRSRNFYGYFIHFGIILTVNLLNNS